jgi:hypothetical protein
VPLVVKVAVAYPFPPPAAFMWISFFTSTGSGPSAPVAPPFAFLGFSCRRANVRLAPLLQWALTRAASSSTGPVVLHGPTRPTSEALAC